MEEPSDGLHEKQKHEEDLAEDKTSLAFGSRWMTLGCIDPIYIYIYMYILLFIGKRPLCMKYPCEKSLCFLPTDRAMEPDLALELNSLGSRHGSTEWFCK